MPCFCGQIIECKIVILGDLSKCSLRGIRLFDKDFARIKFESPVVIKNNQPLTSGCWWLYLGDNFWMSVTEFWYLWILIFWLFVHYFLCMHYFACLNYLVHLLFLDVWPRDQFYMIVKCSLKIHVTGVKFLESVKIHVRGVKIHVVNFLETWTWRLTLDWPWIWPLFRGYFKTQVIYYLYSKQDRMEEIYMIVCSIIDNWILSKRGSYTFFFSQDSLL